MICGGRDAEDLRVVLDAQGFEISQRRRPGRALRDRTRVREK